MGEPKTAPRLIKAKLREAEALSLRLDGCSYGEIAAALGYANASGAYKAVVRALNRLHPVEKAEQLRGMEVARLDRLWRKLWKRFEVEGDLAVADRLLRVMERRAKLLGLDKTKFEVELGVEKKPLRLTDLFPPELIKEGVNDNGNKG